GVPSGLQEKAPLSAGLELARGWRSLLARPSEAVAASGTVDISSSITRRGTNPAEGSHGNSQVAPTTDSLAGAPISPASPSPEQGKRSPSQEWRQQLASSWFLPFGALRTPWLRPAPCA